MLLGKCVELDTPPSHPGALESQVGKHIWKTFEDVAYHGKVAYAHVLVSGSEVLYHVVSVEASPEHYARRHRTLSSSAENACAGSQRTVSCCHAPGRYIHRRRALAPHCASPVLIAPAGSAPDDNRWI